MAHQKKAQLHTIVQSLVPSDRALLLSIDPTEWEQLRQSVPITENSASSPSSQLGLLPPPAADGEGSADPVLHSQPQQQHCADQIAAGDRAETAAEVGPPLSSLLALDEDEVVDFRRKPRIPGPWCLDFTSAGGQPYFSEGMTTSQNATATATGSHAMGQQGSHEAEFAGQLTDRLRRLKTQREEEWVEQQLDKICAARAAGESVRDAIMAEAQEGGATTEESSVDDKIDQYLARHDYSTDSSPTQLCRPSATAAIRGSSSSFLAQPMGQPWPMLSHPPNQQQTQKSRTERAIDQLPISCTSMYTGPNTSGASPNASLCGNAGSTSEKLATEQCYKFVGQISAIMQMHQNINHNELFKFMLNTDRSGAFPAAFGTAKDLLEFIVNECPHISCVKLASGNVALLWLEQSDELMSLLMQTVGKSIRNKHDGQNPAASRRG